MCCGQVTRRLSDSHCLELAYRYNKGELKWHLCAEYRIGTPEFERALTVLASLTTGTHIQPTLTGSSTHVEAL